jgi:hypothetical protein
VSRRLLVVPLAVLAALVGWAEWVHWRAAGRRLGMPGDRVGREAVVILGFSNRGRRANAVNRYRVRAGIRSFSPDADEILLVLCGGAVAGETAEADLMLAYAATLGYTGPVRLDRQSTSTWENVQNAIPFVEGFDTIKIVSNSLHAEKARAYLWIQRHDMARRLARARDYRFAEIPLVKPVAAVVGLANLRRLDRHNAS